MRSFNFFGLDQFLFILLYTFCCSPCGLSSQCIPNVSHPNQIQFHFPHRTQRYTNPLLWRLDNLVCNHHGSIIHRPRACTPSRSAPPPPHKPHLANRPSPTCSAFSRIPISSWDHSSAAPSEWSRSSTPFPAGSAWSPSSLCTT